MRKHETKPGSLSTKRCVSTKRSFDKTSFDELNATEQTKRRRKAPKSSRTIDAFAAASHAVFQTRLTLNTSQMRKPKCGMFPRPLKKGPPYRRAQIGHDRRVTVRTGLSFSPIGPEFRPNANAAVASHRCPSVARGNSALGERSHLGWADADRKPRDPKRAVRNSLKSRHTGYGAAAVSWVSRRQERADFNAGHSVGRLSHTWLYRPLRG